MGYESSGSGTFTIRDARKPEDVLRILNEVGFAVRQDDNSFHVAFYNCVIHHMEKELETIREYLNGEFEIEGEEAGDIWKLSFEDGKIYHSKAKIIYEDKKELKTIDSIWK